MCIKAKNRIFFSFYFFFGFGFGFGIKGKKNQGVGMFRFLSVLIINLPVSHTHFTLLRPLTFFANVSRVYLLNYLYL